MSEANLQTNLLGRSVRADTGRGTREGKIAAVYKDGVYLMFLIEYTDGTLGSHVKEDIRLAY